MIDKSTPATHDDAMQLLRADRVLTASWELVKPSYELLRENIWPAVYLMFLPSLLMAVGLVLVGTAVVPGDSAVNFDGKSTTGLVIAIIGGVWRLVTYPGLMVLQLRACRGEHPSALECFVQGLPRLLPVIIMSIIAGIVIILGFIALVIPGLILIRGLYLAPYYLVDQKLGSVSALRASFDDSRPNAGYIWGTIGVQAVFGMAASVFGKIPVIGNFLSIVIAMIYMFAPAQRYMEVSRELSNAPPSSSRPMQAAS